MSEMVVCNGCSQGLRVPAGHDGPYIRCPACGAVCEVPREAPEWAVTAGSRPASPKPLHKTEDDCAFSAAPNSLSSPTPTKSSDDDDDSPYVIPTDPNEKVRCSKCREKIGRDALVCAYCGYNLETGETFERLYKPVELQWETGLPFRIRFGIFAGAGCMAMIATIIAGVAQGGWATYVISLCIGLMLQAYVLGTYSRLNLTRNRKGRVDLTKTWRVGFIPVRTIEVHWRRHEGVTARQSGEADFWDLIIFLFLLPWGLIPAAIFWIFMIQPGQFDVALTKGHGYAVTILYRGPNQSLAKEIAAKLCEFTKLPNVN